MKKWKITYKEVGRLREDTTTHYGELSREEVIEFFGLNNDDVEYYRVEEIKD